MTQQRLGELPEPIKCRRKKEITTINGLAEMNFSNRLNQSAIRQNVVKIVNNDKSIFNKRLKFPKLVAAVVDVSAILAKNKSH